jgi:hypothetical protein
MKRWLREFIIYSVAGVAGFAVFWVPERVEWVWAAPLGLAFGVVMATLNELFNRPRQFLGDIRRLARRYFAKPS